MGCSMCTPLYQQCVDLKKKKKNLRKTKKCFVELTPKQCNMGEGTGLLGAAENPGGGWWRNSNPNGAYCPTSGLHNKNNKTLLSLY